MKKQHYYIYKDKIEKSITCLNYDKIVGFKFTPKNKIKYDGIIVNQVIVIKQSMIEKVLKRKIKNRLDLYLKIIVDYIDNDSDDSGTYMEALDDLSKYKSIIMYKYKKFLDSKYLKLLLKKISILEFELSKKIKYNVDYENEYEAVEEIHRRR